jgi:hypothetical protein
VSDIMSTVRGFYRHQVRGGSVPGSVNRLLFDVVEPMGGSMPWLEDLPAIVARPLHRLPRSGLSEAQAASLDEFLAMLAVTESVRDKLLILRVRRIWLADLARVRAQGRLECP